MPDLDERVVAGLRSLMDAAPVDADVWPAAERHVVKRRRRRHATVVACVSTGVLLVATASVVALRGTATNSTVATPGPGAEPRVLSEDGPVDGSFTVRARANLTFEPATINVPTGVYAVTLENEADGQHTLSFDDPRTMVAPLEVTARGELKRARIYLGLPGDYTFACLIPGHRVAGMTGVVHVTGPPVTAPRSQASSALPPARE